MSRSLSLTFFARLIGMVVLGSCTFALVSAKAPPLVAYLVEAHASTDQSARFVSRAIVYRLGDRQATAFTFGQPVTEMRMIAQPAVQRQLRSRADGFQYTLKLRMFDASGVEVGQRELYLHAPSPDAVFASGEKWRFFRKRPEMVAGQDDLVIELGARVARVEVLLGEADPGIIGVDMRLYERRPFFGDNAITTFRRRSDAEQAQMASANAFPAAMLTEAEMNFIALNKWYPVGPTGINGRDYMALVLYEGWKRPEEDEAPAAAERAGS